MLLVPLLNHLLKHNTWAKVPLQRIAGKVALLEFADKEKTENRIENAVHGISTAFFAKNAQATLPPLCVQITEQGQFSYLSKNHEADVTPHVIIRLSLPNTFPLPPTREQLRDALGDAHLQGEVRTAQVLGEVLPYLRWELADDLTPLIGEVAAQGVQDFAQRGITVAQTAARMAHIEAQAASQRNPLLAPLLVQKSQHAELHAEVSRLATQLTQLEQRMSRLL